MSGTQTTQRTQDVQAGAGVGQNSSQQPEAGDNIEITAEVIERMAEAIEDLYPEYYDCQTFVTMSNQAECGRAIRLACRNGTAAAAQLPGAVLSWVRSTPTFRLDNPHANGNGTLFVDIVPDIE